MAVYAYIYSGFPADKDRKYYVCNYRRGNAYTYQVVPQLQREFDQRDYDDKTRINWDRFKKLRRAGYLYTSSQEEKRRPLYGDRGEDDPPGDFELLSEWLGGERWPGEVDWEELGERLRRSLEAGRRLPDDLRELAEQVATDQGESWAECYERLRQRHVEAAGFHLDLSPDDDNHASGSGRLFERVREARPTPERFDEQTCLERLSESVGEGYFEDWEAVFEKLGPEEAWYESIERASGEAVGVPDPTLYDIQWALAEQLQALELHHPTAPALELESPRPLHARFHAGAEAALVLRLADYPSWVDRDRLVEQLRRETAGGRLAGWSDEGLEALAALLVDPTTDRASPSAPTSEFCAEYLLWEFDEAIRRGLDERIDDGRTAWNYSRLHDELVVSSTAVDDADRLEEARRIVSEALETASLEAGGDWESWRAEESPLVISGLPVPIESGEPIPLADEQRREVETACQRVRDGETDDSDRSRLETAYRRTGDLRYQTLASPACRTDVETLLESITLWAFHEAIWRGWMSLGTG